MAREGVDVRHQLCFVQPRRRPADAFGEGDLDAGGLAHKGPKDQLFPLHEIDTGPVDAP